MLGFYGTNLEAWPSSPSNQICRALNPHASCALLAWMPMQDLARTEDIVRTVRHLTGVRAHPQKRRRFVRKEAIKRGADGHPWRIIEVIDHYSLLIRRRCFADHAKRRMPYAHGRRKNATICYSYVLRAHGRANEPARDMPMFERESGRPPPAVSRHASAYAKYICDAV